jgi:hypothetical protein
VAIALRLAFIIGLTPGSFETLLLDNNTMPTYSVQ